MSEISDPIDEQTETEFEVVAARKLAVLGKPLRLHIYRFLVKAGHTGASVGTIQQHLLARDLRVPASTLSHHVSQLVWAGLIKQNRQGTTLYCQVEFPAMDSLITFLQSECCSAEYLTEQANIKKTPTFGARHV